jgi:transposase
MQIKERQKEQLTFFAEQLGEIIGSKTNVSIGHDLYVDVLRSAELYTAKGRIRGRRLTAAVRRWLAPLRQSQPFDRLSSALSVERNWATTTIACDGGFTNPIKHIVVWGAIGCKWSDMINAASARGHQMELKLRFNSSTPPSDSVAIETLRRVGTLTAAARELGCDVTTMAVWADKLGWNRKRKPKKVNSVLRIELTEAITNGGSSSELARRFDVSVSTVNRIKRTLRS